MIRPSVKRSHEKLQKRTVRTESLAKGLDVDPQQGAPCGNGRFRWIEVNRLIIVSLCEVIVLVEADAVLVHIAKVEGGL